MAGFDIWVRPKGKKMNIIDFLCQLHTICHFQTREGKKYGTASKSELKRWIINGAIEVNGEKVTDVSEVMNYPIYSFVLFPKNKVTLW